MRHLRALLAAALLATPALAALQDGQVINLKCTGGNGTLVYLDGDPAAGTVKLVATTTEDPQGTTWQVVAVPNSVNVFYLKCSATGAKPWLDGDTGFATVQLRDTNTGFSSTAWQVFDNGGGAIYLMCLAPPSSYPWLDGETVQGTVGLRQNNVNYPGTRWQVQIAATSVPGCFDLSSPANSASVGNPPTLTWAASTGATSYSVRIYGGSCANGDPVYSVDNVTGTSLRVPSGKLQNGQTYA